MTAAAADQVYPFRDRRSRYIGYSMVTHEPLKNHQLKTLKEKLL